MLPVPQPDHKRRGLELCEVIAVEKKKKEPEYELLFLSAVPVHSCSLNRPLRTRSTDVLFQTGINLYIQSWLNDILVVSSSEKQGTNSH